MFTEVYLKPRRISMMEFFAKIDNKLQLLTIFAKMLPDRCLTGSYIYTSGSLDASREMVPVDYFANEISFRKKNI